jgi:hypothetical protein
MDARRPWMAPFVPLWHPLAAALDETRRGGADWRAALSALARARGVRTASGHALSFVAAGDAGDAAYEAHIAATGRVPTRASPHDLFNALAWLVYPQTKAALNARQAEAIARDGVGARRGPARDAATLIDESGLLLGARDARVFAQLAARDWHALLVHDRARWQRDVVPLAFGHALLDKLCGPYKAVTAAVICLPAGRREQLQPERLDAAAARFVMAPGLAPAALQHLPVLGIPGWWPANDDASFYDDARVFRPARPSRD